MQTQTHKPQLVVIIPGTNTYAAYRGREVVDVATFNRPLFPDEIEAFRLNPAALTGSPQAEEGATAA